MNVVEVGEPFENGEGDLSDNVDVDGSVLSVDVVERSVRG